MVARARRASRRTHTYCMLITCLQIGSTFGRVKIASAINLLGPPRGGKSAALSVWSGLGVLMELPKELPRRPRGAVESQQSRLSRGSGFAVQARRDATTLMSFVMRAYSPRAASGLARPQASLCVEIRA